MSREEILSRLNALRGLFAIEIILGHVVRYETSPVYLVGKFMIISVAFFFFVSAMGMAVSLETKENYLKDFLRKKCGYLLFLAAAAYGFSCLVELALPSHGYFYLPTPPGALSFLRSFLNTTNWYIWELLCFYLLFYLLCRLIRRKPVRILLYTLLTVGIMLFSWFYLYEGFYASSLCFPLGFLFGCYFDAAYSFLKRAAGMIMTAALTLTGLSCFLFTEETLFTMVVLRNAMCIGAMLLLLYLIALVDLRCRFTRILAEYSTELYLFQFVWLHYFETEQMHWAVRCAAVLAATVCSALIVHPLIRSVKRKLG